VGQPTGEELQAHYDGNVETPDKCRGWGLLLQVPLLSLR
jgi:hypothetical protein